jgi:hypothetical protein
MPFSAKVPASFYLRSKDNALFSVIAMPGRTKAVLLFLFRRRKPWKSTKQPFLCFAEDSGRTNQQLLCF